MHVQGHIRILLNKAPDDRRQGVTRLGVGGRDAQVAFALITELLGNLLDALYPTQNLPGLPDNDLAARGNAGQVLAAAGKNLEPQLGCEVNRLWAVADTLRSWCATSQI